MRSIVGIQRSRLCDVWKGSGGSSLKTQGTTGNDWRTATGWDGTSAAIRLYDIVSIYPNSCWRPASVCGTPDPLLVEEHCRESLPAKDPASPTLHDIYKTSLQRATISQETHPCLSALLPSQRRPELFMPALLDQRTTFFFPSYYQAEQFIYYNHHYCRRYYTTLLLLI